MGKWFALLNVLRRGAMVSDPKALKDRGSLVLLLTPLLIAIVKALKGFGYDIPLTEADAASLAAGIAVVVGLFVNYASSDKVGLPGLAPVPPVAGPDFPAIDVPSAAPLDGPRGSSSEG